MKPSVQLRLPSDINRQLSLLAGAYDVSRAVMATTLIAIAYRQTFREPHAYERADQLRAAGQLLTGQLPAVPEDRPQ